MLNHLFTIIAVIETWETTLNAMHFHIPGYTILSVPRSNDNKCKGGGVALYVHDDIKFDVRNDLCLFGNNSFECVFIETCTPSRQKYIVGCIYRPPD